VTSSEPTGAAEPLAPHLTVADALALPVLRRGLPEVAAGAEQLDRPIRWVHVGEVPSLAQLLRGGELLLTTGIGLGRRASDQGRFVEQLAARGAAALLVALGTTLEELPRPLVVAAQVAQLPLVALRRQVPFVAVTEAIHTEIANGRYGLLRRGHDLNRRFAELLLAGDGIPEVLGALAEVLGNPVFLESGDGRLLFHVDPRADGDALDAWDAIERGGRISLGGAGLAAEVPAGAGPAARLVVLPVAAALDDVAAVAVDRAAAVVALALQRSRQEEELLGRERGNFLADLADGRSAAADAARQARAIGFGSRARALLPMAAQAAGPVSGEEWSRVMRDLRRRVEARGLAVLVGVRPRSRKLLLLAALADPAARDVTADAVAAAIGAAASGGLAHAVTIVAGHATSWEDAGAGLRTAAESAAIAAALPPAPWHDVARLDLLRLLGRWHDRDALARFAERTLEPLLAHDRGRKHQLLPTLEALCARSGQKAETARALHLNRQALYQRLARIEQLLEVDLDDPEQLLALNVALQARTVLAAVA
jgi:purine catabolism regulator